MRARWWLALSLALNVVLVSYWYKDVPVLSNDSIIIRQKETVTVPGPVKNNVVVRRQFFSWSEIESDDYEKYVVNLRRIGCPEKTIRDIIVADVNQMFAERRAAEIVPADSQWWKSEPDLDQTEATMNKIEQLEKERTTLLTKLLGPNWNTDIEKPRALGAVSLDGPVLGALSAETKRKVQDLAVKSSQRARQYIDQAGANVDPVQLAKLRAEHRQELAKILSPAEMEEYLLRHSVNAALLRTQLKGFNPTPEEFRAIFRARDQIDNEIQLNYSGTDAASANARAELERRRDDAIKAALGPERGGLYETTSDPLFHQARELAENSGADPEKVIPLYQIEVEAARERARIAADATLTASARDLRLRQAQVDAESARRKILGIQDATAANEPPALPVQ